MWLAPQLLGHGLPHVVCIETGKRTVWPSSIVCWFYLQLVNGLRPRLPEGWGLCSDRDGWGGAGAAWVRLQILSGGGWGDGVCLCVCVLIWAERSPQSTQGTFPFFFFFCPSEYIHLLIFHDKLFVCWWVDDVCWQVNDEVSLSLSVPCMLSHVQVFATPWTVSRQVLCSWDCLDKSAGVGCRFLPQGGLPGWRIEPEFPVPPASAGGFLPPVPLREGPVFRDRI